MSRIIPYTLIVCCIAFAAQAQQVPPDTIVAWFNSVCNRPLQMDAFFAIIKFHSGYGYGTPYRLLEVKPEYDRQDVKQAFEVFVRSISVNYPDCSGGFVASPYLGDCINDPNFVEETDYKEHEILSLYVNWGIQTDLYPIADDLLGNDPSYSAFLMDKMGVGYFTWALGKVQSDTSYIRGLGDAGLYLSEFKGARPEMVAAAVNVLHAYAISSHIYQRRGAVSGLIDAYLAGYSQVKPDLDALKNDPSEEVRNWWRIDISNAHKDNQLLEFELNE
jgi:hypothetical protein